MWVWVWVPPVHTRYLDATSLEADQYSSGQLSIRFEPSTSAGWTRLPQRQPFRRLPSDVDRVYLAPQAPIGILNLRSGNSTEAKQVRSWSLITKYIRYSRGFRSLRAWRTYAPAVMSLPTRNARDVAKSGTAPSSGKIPIGPITFSTVRGQKTSQLVTAWFAPP